MPSRTPTWWQRFTRAAQAGVRVELIIRDTCRLRPGIPGLSANVTVVSIIGRFLEHARIEFLATAATKYFIGSADPMSRNLDSRVEVVTPVEAPALQARLKFVLDAAARPPGAADERPRRRERVARDEEARRLGCDLHARGRGSSRWSIALWASPRMARVGGEPK